MMKLLKILLIFLIIVGCRSTKRNVERTKQQAAITNEQKGVTITSEQSNVTITDEKNLGVIIISENDQVELNQADPDKEISIIDSKGNKTTVKGADIKINKDKKTETKKDNSVTITNESTEKETKAANESKSKIDTSSDAKKIAKESSGTSPFTSIGIGLGIVGLLIFGYYKRTAIGKAIRKLTG